MTMTEHEARTGDKTMHDEAERPALVGGGYVPQMNLRGVLTEALAFVIDHADKDEEPEHWTLTKELRAALAAPSLPAAQDGWVMVPRVPALEMIRAMQSAGHDGMDQISYWAQKYTAMLAAVPTPNAIRGDKGAEAVQAEVVGKVRQRRGVHGDFDGFDVDWLLEGGIHAVGLDGDTYLYVLDIPVPEDGHIELFAPTQAAAKEELNNAV